MEEKTYPSSIDYLIESKEKAPDKTAVTINRKGLKQKIIYKELWNAVQNTAKKLQEKGINKRSKIALFGNNSVHWTVAFFACQVLGAIISPIWTTRSRNEIRSQLADLDPDLIIYDKDDIDPKTKQKEVFEENKKGTIQLEKITSKNSGELNVEPIPDEGEETKEINPYKIKDSDTVVIFYTSGTTGRPKGVPLTNINLASNLIGLKSKIELGSSDVIGHIAPWYHVMGFNLTLLLPTKLKGKNVYIDEYIAAKNLIDEIRKNKVTIFLGVPKLYEQMIVKFERAAETAYAIPQAFSSYRKKRKENPGKLKSDLGILAHSLAASFSKTFGIRKIRRYWKWSRPIKSLKKTKDTIKKQINILILGLLYPKKPKWAGKLIKKKLGPQFRFFATGTAPFPESTEQKFIELDLPVLNGCGMSEHSPLMFMPQEGMVEKGTVGQPLPNTSYVIFVRNEDTGELIRVAEQGEEGEILIPADNPSLFNGYHNRPETNKKVFVKIDGKKMFRTGDIAKTNENHNIKLSGRKNNRIVPPTGERFSAEYIEGELSLELMKSQFIENFFVRGNYNEKRGGEEVQIIIEPDFTALIKKRISSYEKLKKELTETWKQASKKTSLTPNKRPKSMLIAGNIPITGGLDIKRNTFQDNEKELIINNDTTYLKFLVLKTKYTEQEIKQTNPDLEKILT